MQIVIHRIDWLYNLFKNYKLYMKKDILISIKGEKYERLRRIL